MTDWKASIDQWRARHAVRTLRALSRPVVERASADLGSFPTDLLVLYLCTNGLSKDAFVIFSIADDSDPKRTWNSVQRANRQGQTEVLVGYETDVTSRFLVIGQVAYERGALVERSTGALWFEDDEKLVHTNHSLEPFIDACLRDIDCA